MYEIQNIEGLYGNGIVLVDVGVYLESLIKIHEKNEFGLRLKDGVWG